MIGTEQFQLKPETIQQLQKVAAKQGCSIDALISRWLATEDTSSQLETSIQSDFFDLSLDFFCILDEFGHVLATNRTLTKMIPVVAEKLLNIPFTELVLRDDREMVSALLQMPADQSTLVSFICRHRYFDKTIKWYLWTLYPRPSSKICAIGRDITPYKEMEVKELQRNIFAEALLDTVIAINSSLALDQVLDRILSNVGKVVAYEHVSILLVEANQVEVVGVQNRSPHQNSVQSVKGKRFSIAGNEYLNQMFQNQESIIVSEIEHAPEWIDPSVTDGLRAFLGAPIVLEGQVIGFLCVFNANTGFFTFLHARQLITFANQAGIAINNARLFEQAQTVAVLHERQRVAQELHDSVNQDLFAASTYADLLPKAINKRPDLVPQYATDISQLIRGAVAQMRMILIELHPDTLITTGLGVLIQQLCEVFSRQTNIPLELAINNNQFILEEKPQIAIYRIVQEALHNIEKHANATQVKIELRMTNNHVNLIIEDNGLGFNIMGIKEVQFGVRGMQERARSIEADFFIESQVGAGTKISLRKKCNVNPNPHSHHINR